MTFNVEINMNHNEQVLRSMGFDCTIVKKHHGGSNSLVCWLCPKGTYGTGDSSIKQLGCRLCPAGMVIAMVIAMFTLAEFKSFVMHSKAFGNLFCNSQKSFHTSPGSSDSNTRGYRSFFKLNNGICIYKKILDVKFFV